MTTDSITGSNSSPVAMEEAIMIVLLMLFLSSDGCNDGMLSADNPTVKAVVTIEIKCGYKLLHACKLLRSLPGILVVIAVVGMMYPM